MIKRLKTVNCTMCKSDDEIVWNDSWKFEHKHYDKAELCLKCAKEYLPDCIFICDFCNDEFVARNKKQKEIVEKIRLDGSKIKCLNCWKSLKRKFGFSDVKKESDKGGKL